MSNKCNCQIPNTDLVGRCFKCGGFVEIPISKPMTNEERIKADAVKAYPLTNGNALETGKRIGYIAGATAAHERAQKRMQRLIDVLVKIVQSPVPANEREYMSWFVTAKNIAGGAISEWEADNEIDQWKSGKEVGDE